MKPQDAYLFEDAAKMLEMSGLAGKDAREAATFLREVAAHLRAEETIETSDTELFKKLEWSAQAGDSGASSASAACPVCGGLKEGMGHEAGCALARRLGR